MLEGLRGNNRSAVLDACFVDICNMNDQGTLDGDLGGIGVRHHTLGLQPFLTLLGIHFVRASARDLFSRPCITIRDVAI